MRAVGSEIALRKSFLNAAWTHRGAGGGTSATTYSAKGLPELAAQSVLTIPAIIAGYPAVTFVCSGKTQFP